MRHFYCVFLHWTVCASTEWSRLKCSSFWLDLLWVQQSFLSDKTCGLSILNQKGFFFYSSCFAHHFVLSRINVSNPWRERPYFTLWMQQRVLSIECSPLFLLQQLDRLGWLYNWTDRRKMDIVIEMNNSVDTCLLKFGLDDNMFVMLQMPK